MQSIITRYRGPTARKPSRISAWASGGGTEAATRISVGYDYELTADQNHRAAACELARRLGWRGRWHQGELSATQEIFVREALDGAPGFELENHQ